MLQHLLFNKPYLNLESLSVPLLFYFNCRNSAYNPSLIFSSICFSFILIVNVRKTWSTNSPVFALHSIYYRLFYLANAKASYKWIYLYSLRSDFVPTRITWVFSFTESVRLLIQLPINIWFRTDWIKGLSWVNAERNYCPVACFIIILSNCFILLLPCSIPYLKFYLHPINLFYPP